MNYGNRKPKRPLVFICYSKNNKPFVRKLADRLKRDGVDVWIDHLEIRIGDSIHNKINEGLAKSDFLIVVLSKDSVKSRWVREELNSAASLEKLSDSGVFILPLLLEQCDVPPLLLDRRYANFADDEESAYRELLDGIFLHFKEKHPQIAVEQLAPPTPKRVYDIIITPFVFDLDLFMAIPPRSFELMVAMLFEALGFTVEVTPITRDGGADVVAMKAPALGLSPIKTIIECKRYTLPKKVGVEVVRQLRGAMYSYGASRGIIVTTSYFTKEAKTLAQNFMIDLVDIDKLRQMMRSVDAQTFLDMLRRQERKNGG